MPTKHKEIDFEKIIEWHLVNKGGYTEGNGGGVLRHKPFLRAINAAVAGITRKRTQ